jgi:hypothetical protein
MALRHLADAIVDLAMAGLEFDRHRGIWHHDDGAPTNPFLDPMLPSTTTSSEPPNSLPREAKSSSSQVEASRDGNAPNSDDDDDDDDDVRLTRSHQGPPHLRFSPEIGHDHDHRDRDGPSAAASSSSSAPKAVDNGAVPAAVAAGVLPVPFSISLVLQNTGSVARDHLASERTFLAYVRTSLSFASAGVGRSFRLLVHPLF